MCVVVSIDCAINKIYGDVTLSYWRTVCVLRAFRWVSLTLIYSNLKLQLNQKYPSNRFGNQVLCAYLK